jgi:hypothetical protein
VVNYLFHLFEVLQLQPLNLLLHLILLVLNYQYLHLLML